MRITEEEAVQRLNAGEVVSLPTETVYGMAASVHCPEAVQAIFTLKGRPADNPLIIHLASFDQLTAFTDRFPPDLEALAEKFWPGAMTLVIPVDQEAVSSMIRAGLPTAAFRVPQRQKTREVIAKTGPLVMPSANLSGKPSATAAEHVEQDFGQDFPVMDGGFCEEGVESTILLYYGDRWAIVRRGALAAEMFIPILGYQPEFLKQEDPKKPICPGQMYRHYAPQAILHLCRTIPDNAHTILGYTGVRYPDNAHIYLLGTKQDPRSVAESLYRTLRRLDQEGVKEVWIDVDIPNEGLWKTIHDRLARAAS
ncbi:MAG: threonylcarbamoyl-AMP synthase [Chlamydiales bacterium]|nr:threonylcarbamoyl-AMP synthase [Chlamydiia bacterium]MCP5507931.1 threonylcarbamoyl-AMP synthase [Chlamydiales bacterium]